jgi:hypothetical protein
VSGTSQDQIGEGTCRRRTRRDEPSEKIITALVLVRSPEM